MRGKDFSERTYPHLSDTKFPDLPTVNVYKYQNEVPYEDYSDTVKIKMMNVSWCGDYDNTVYFETKEERDAWFIAQDGLVQELPTMFRLYPSGTIKVPCTIDEAMNYNYVMIDYGKTLYQEGLSDNHIMFYFINDVQQKSPNATELTLVVDFWTTYINDMDIEYVNLQRGHAPMVETPADEYLDSPIDNCEFLLTPDVNYGDFQRVITTEPVIFNDDPNAITVGFLTNASMQKYWTDGSGNPKIPTAAFEYGQAFSAIDIFVIENVSRWDYFRNSVTNQCPQFWETVKGMFIIPIKLITESNYLSGNAFEFCGERCHHLETDSDKLIEVIDFTKEKFNYPDEFSDIAKLYTFPYAAVEVDDFKGHQTIIKIEDTTGQIELHTIMCDMYPFLNIEAYMTGIGGTGKATISFKNAYENTFRIGGRDYNFTTKWQIPTFAVQLEVEDNWRLNGKIQSDMFLTNNSRQALTIRDNSYDYSRVAGYNAITGKNLSLVNTLDTQIPTNNEVFLIHEKEQYHSFARNLLKSRAAQVYSSDNLAATTVSGVASNIVTGTIASVATGSPIPVANSAISGAASAYNASVIISNKLDAVQIDGLVENNYMQALYGNGFSLLNPEDLLDDTLLDPTTTYADKRIGVDGAYTRVTALSNYNPSIAAGAFEDDKYIAERTNLTTLTNNNATATENIYTNNRRLIIGGEVSYLNRSFVESDAIELPGTANRTYAADIANYNNRWSSEYKQKLLDNPPEFGQLTGTPDIISKPFGVRYNFITQSKNAIRQAGEQFLRYGYMLNMEWKIESFNLMSMFTYWKCDRVYCNDKGVYEGAQDMIKSILVAGTTVWRNPEDIGVKSIYQNKIPQ